MLLACSVSPGRSPDLPAKAAARPATSPSSDDGERVAQFSRVAAAAMKAGKLVDAEAALRSALELDPHDEVILYNLACVKSLQGRGDAAMDCLERAAREGFTDFVHIQRDPDLAGIRQLPRYQDLLAHKDEYQRRQAIRLVQWLKRELGPAYTYDVDEPHKLIFAACTDQQTLEALKRHLAMQESSLCQQLFQHRPDQYITVILPSAADFRRFMPRAGVGGYYVPEQRRLVVQRLGSFMAHEFTHALHDADRSAEGQEHPVWICEGLATLMEPARFEGEKLILRDGFRLAEIQAAGRQEHLVPLARLFTMDQPAFERTPINAYGQSGSIMLYLYEKGLLRKFYETYKAAYATDKTGRLALEQATGMKLMEFEREWKAWMLSRTPPAQTTGPQGAVLGVRFAAVNDGLRVASLVPTGPAAQRGIRVGDVLVGINQTDIRDYDALLQTLADCHPGQSVTLHLRRGVQYLEVPITLARR